MIMKFLAGLSSDFNSDQFNIMIDAGEVFGEYNLSITCDKQVEDDERFNLTFSLTNIYPRIITNQSTAIVHIIDSTGNSDILLCQWLLMFII